jgi:chromosome partitioning protein
MRILAFQSQKGGSGKTTLACHIAVAAYEAGQRVVVIDTDPQQSATGWGQAREAAEPVIATVSVSDLARVLAAAEAERIDLAIIDSAPHAAPDAGKIARAAGAAMSSTSAAPWGPGDCSKASRPTRMADVSRA